MLVGKPAFPGTIQTMIFEQIKKGNILWPKEDDNPLSENARDLIEKILKINPLERLGINPAQIK